MIRMFTALLAVLALSVPSACTKKQEPAPAQQVRASATRAYEKYFGPVPTIDKGTCFAFVIYFPSARLPGKVVPFPFFTFDEGSMKKVAVERLLGGMHVPAYDGEIVQPFAQGVRLLELARADGLWRVDLSGNFLAGGTDPDGMVHALVMTLTQFEGVNGIRILSEGKDLDYAWGPQRPDPSSVIEPSPPRLLSVTAVRDKGAKDVEDVGVYFDRPVDIKELKMTDREGKSFAGEMFHSVFDMAVVLRPKEPGRFAKGMPLKVRWKVTDKKGRQAEGTEEVELEVKEH